MGPTYESHVYLWEYDQRTAFTGCPCALPRNLPAVSAPPRRSGLAVWGIASVTGNRLLLVQALHDHQPNQQLAMDPYTVE